ncbi:leucine-rich repeat domain-containing protein (plasmid) [Paenibacillus cellulosilyticus]|uniref:leucine-rich repeat domain-containing protein n=1 Tax=Paenibacillus cellulosilyticus TaxID=375489 RepID=UPI001580B35F|nr:leucine-rich repeat domain-containing protein [Paenibacillus cellulosilyticus]QKS48643.1 leucine-rich repeat domain-containing protein [Paenibacillus cellulosilyticus]
MVSKRLGMKFIALLLLVVMLVPMNALTTAAAAKTSAVKVQLTASTYKVAVGSTLTLRATTQPKLTFTYSSDSSKIAIVTQAGVVTGKSVGKAKITAKVTQNGYSGYATVTVEVTAAKNTSVPNTSTNTTDPADLKKVVFKDANLEAVIRAIIAKPTGDILVKDVLGIKSITNAQIYQNSTGRIRDLTGLEALRNLTSLDLFNNLVTDLSPLANLKQLKKLDIGYNTVRDLTPLKNLKLEELHAIENFISDVKPLAGVTTLKSLWISYNNVKDISALKSLTQLEGLQASNNLISDISVIGQMPKLRAVRFEDNPLLDAAPALRKESHEEDQVLKNAALAGKEARDVIARLIKPGMSDLVKETAIHDYLLNKITYDWQYYSKRIKTGTDPYGIYGALIEGISVCEGYARAMNLLGQLAGLDIMYISGTSLGGVGHAWNLVKINGSYAHVDVTWDDGNPWQQDQNNVYKRAHFNLSQNQRLNEIYWDTDRYPEAFSDAVAPSSNDYPIKVSFNSEIPVTRDTIVWAILSLQWKEGEYTAYSDVKTKLIFRGNTKTVEGELIVPADVPLASGNVDYVFKYELYSIGDSGHIGFGQMKDPFLFNGNGIRGSVLRGTMTNLNETLKLTLLKVGSQGTSYSQTESAGMADSLQANWFETYVSQSFPQPDGSVYNLYSIHNVSSFTLPAYSAIYVTAGSNVQKFEDQYYNYNFGGKILIANHTDKPKTVKAKDIGFSLEGMYTDSGGTITYPDGTSFTEKSTGPYIRFIAFDGDFDEAVPLDEIIRANKHRFVGEWLTVSPK